MKKSHKKIIDLLNSGHWFKRNDYSFKTKNVYKCQKFVGTIRYSTLDEMVKLGLLKIAVTDGGYIQDYVVA